MAINGRKRNPSCRRLRAYIGTTGQTKQSFKGWWVKLFERWVQGQPGILETVSKNQKPHFLLRRHGSLMLLFFSALENWHQNQCSFLPWTYGKVSFPNRFPPFSENQILNSLESSSPQLMRLFFLLAWRRLSSHRHWTFSSHPHCTLPTYFPASLPSGSTLFLSLIRKEQVSET